MSGKFILNADDFGMSNAVNRAVLEAYGSGFLKSVSLLPNGVAFDEAVNDILPRCPDLGVGVQLNLTEGNSICSDVNLLADANMQFTNSYLTLLIRSYNPKEKDFLPQVEREFRRQIENVLAKTKVSHISSHSHIHSIPPIFEIVCRLAKEYNIPQVRTHFEKFYFVPEPLRHLKKGYIADIFKKFCLNFLTIFNDNTVTRYRLKTNDYILGIGYSSTLDALSVSYGIDVLKYNNIVVETIIHPCRYKEGIINNHFNEYMLAKNSKLKEKLLDLNYDITNYVKKTDETAKENPEESPEE